MRSGVVYGWDRGDVTVIFIAYLCMDRPYMVFDEMKLVTETQCGLVGSCVGDTCSMAQTHTVYHGMAFEPGTFISSANNSYDAVVPMMGPPSAGSINRKMLCQVCGALSSGLHFGVFTCEGCKCFYRRSIKEGANYACAKERNCEITMETRNSCRYCRFQKCLALGMSKEGIKLGRRPKVDSDAFQHGFYPPGEMDYHTHGYWTSMDHMSTFKTEPVFTKSDETRDHLVYGDVASLNYAMKPEPYPTCGQPPNGLHYGQDGFNGSHPDGQMNGHPAHFSDPNLKSERHLSIYHHPHGCMPPEMYLEHPQSQHHPQGAQLQTWTSELSPTTSGSGSEDNWDSSTVMHNRVPASVSLTLPEVQSGAAAAMAYANLYRGKNDSNEKSVKCKEEGAVQNGQLEMHRCNSTSYTELVPRKNKSDFSDDYHKANHVSLYQESKSKTLNSPSRVGAGSVSPHRLKATTREEGSPHMTWLESASSPGKRKSPEQLDDVGKARKLSSSCRSESKHLCQSKQIHLIQELIDNFLPLERVVSYQWEAYQQSYGEQVFSDMQPRYKDSAHLTAFLKTHGEEVLYQIRKFAANLPGFEELSQSQKDGLLGCTAPSIITTCLLQSEHGSSAGDKHEKGSISSIDEGACFCAVILLMAGKHSKTLDNELCSKLSIVIEDYINETLTRRNPEKLQWLLQQLHQKLHWKDTKE